MDDNILNVSIELINDGIKFSSTAENYPAVISDYYPPFGNNEGYKPLQLFLISFGTCISGTILPLLRKMNMHIHKYSVSVEGKRRTEHPTGFEKIKLFISLYSNDIEEADMDKVIKMSEEKYCPVCAMIKNNVDVEIEYKIEKV